MFVNNFVYCSMKKTKCIICNSEIQGFGHNTEPVKKGRCCELCNDIKVIPARILELV